MLPGTDRQVLPNESADVTEVMHILGGGHTTTAANGPSVQTVGLQDTTGLSGQVKSTHGRTISEELVVLAERISAPKAAGAVVAREATAAPLQLKHDNGKASVEEGFVLVSGKDYAQMHAHTGGMRAAAAPDAMLANAAASHLSAPTIVPTTPAPPAYEAPVTTEAATGLLSEEPVVQTTARPTVDTARPTVDTSEKWDDAGCGFLDSMVDQFVNVQICERRKREQAEEIAMMQQQQDEDSDDADAPRGDNGAVPMYSLNGSNPRLITPRHLEGEQPRSRLQRSGSNPGSRPMTTPSSVTSASASEASFGRSRSLPRNALTLLASTPTATQTVQSELSPQRGRAVASAASAPVSPVRQWMRSNCGAIQEVALISAQFLLVFLVLVFLLGPEAPAQLMALAVLSVVVAVLCGIFFYSMGSRATDPDSDAVDSDDADSNPPAQPKFKKD